jgi:predicted transcriptional regulator
MLQSNWSNLNQQNCFMNSKEEQEVNQLKNNLKTHEILYMKMLLEIYEKTKEENVLQKIKFLEKILDNSSHSTFDEFTAGLKEENFKIVKQTLKEKLKTSIHSSCCENSTDGLKMIEKLKKLHHKREIKFKPRH